MPQVAKSFSEQPLRHRLEAYVGPSAHREIKLLKSKYVTRNLGGAIDTFTQNCLASGFEKQFIKSQTNMTCDRRSPKDHHQSVINTRIFIE